MSITSLSCANRPWIKYRRFLFLLYCTALFLTGWWIGWVLLLLIVPAGGLTNQGSAPNSSTGHGCGKRRPSDIMVRRAPPDSSPMRF